MDHTTGAAAAVAAAPPPNLLHVQFKNPEYLSYLSALHQHALHTSSSSAATATSKFDPQHPLTEYNVLDYFATSPFFDRRSNNEQIRMQNIANGLNPNSAMSASQLEQELKRFTGLEFVLVHAKAGAFVIQRRWRTSPSEATPLAAYYVINESIYQAPDLYAVLASRLQSAVYDLRSSLTRQRQSRATFNPRSGHHGRFIQHQQEDDDEDDQEEANDEDIDGQVNKGGEDGDTDATDEQRERDEDRSARKDQLYRQRSAAAPPNDDLLAREAKRLKAV